MNVLCVLYTKKEWEEDATEYTLGSANIIHNVSVLYIYYIVKGEGGGCYRIYTLGTGHIIDSVNELYIL